MRLSFSTSADNMKLLGLITARGGSKRIPRKNVRDVAGKPLIAWTIEEACKSDLLSAVVVSTDDAEIANISVKFGAQVPFMRPASLAGDTTPHIECVLHALDSLTSLGYGFFDAVVLLQPTSPLRTVEDINGTIKVAMDTHAEAVVSVNESTEHPYFTRFLDDKSCLVPIVEQSLVYPLKQSLQPTYFINGAVYFNTVESLNKHNSFYPQHLQGYVMPPERSLQVDYEYELVMVDFLLSKQHLNK